MTKLTLITSLFLTTSAMSSTIVCTGSRLKAPIKLSTHSVSFLPAAGAMGRNIASLIPARNKKTQRGITKLFTYEGNKYKLHIQDLKKFSEVDDYLTIRSSLGHEITYPVDCKKES